MKSSPQTDERTLTQIILIRHGETDWNVEGRYQGQADPPLNERGLSQARELAKKLAGAEISVLYTSPLTRAYQTAEVIAACLGVPLYSDARLMEIHQGDWQTRLRSEIEALYPDLFKRWESEPWEVTPPQGERLAQVQARVAAAVDDLLTRHAGQRIGIVSHRIPLALIKLRYQGLESNIVRSLEMPNTYFEEITITSVR